MTAAQQKAPGGNGGDSWQNTHLNHSPSHSRPQARAFRQFPPYSNQARRRLDPSQARRIAAFSTLFIHAGLDAWDWMYDTRAAILSPVGQDVEACDWSVCALATPPVLLIDRGATDEHLERVALACLRDGAQRVMVLQPGHDSVTFTGQGVTHGAI